VILLIVRIFLVDRDRYGPFASKTGLRSPEKRGSGESSEEKGGLGWFAARVAPIPNPVSPACARVFRDHDGLLRTVFSAKVRSSRT